MQGMTITEKIISRTAEKDFVKPGETYWVKPDLLFLYDWPGITDKYAHLIKNKLGVEKLPLADRTTVFIDHMVPANGEKEALFHKSTIEWAESQGMRLCEGKGIGHQVAGELGLVTPGKMIAHFDLHVQTLGAFGALPLSFMSDVLTLMSLGRIWIDVPSTVRIELLRSFQEGVGGRDLIHKIICEKGADWGINSVLEFVGQGAEEMSIDQRMNMLAQVTFTGAASGIFPIDDKGKKYLKDHGVDSFDEIRTDSDAIYRETVKYDLSLVEPYVVKAGSPGNACKLSDVTGMAINQGYIGSCASGRLDDIQIAAKILKGKKIKSGFKLFVVPSSGEIMAKAIEDGSLGVLAEAGAFISSASCDYCYGRTQSLMSGQRAVSTGTLNVPGRMGSVDAEIYQASAATVAATAVEGLIDDPRKFLV